MLEKQPATIISKTTFSERIIHSQNCESLNSSGTVSRKTSTASDYTPENTLIQDSKASFLDQTNVIFTTKSCMSELENSSRYGLNSANNQHVVTSTVMGDETRISLKPGQKIDVKIVMLKQEPNVDADVLNEKVKDVAAVVANVDKLKTTASGPQQVIETDLQTNDSKAKTPQRKISRFLVCPVLSQLDMPKDKDFGGQSSIDSGNSTPGTDVNYDPMGKVSHPVTVQKVDASAETAMREGVIPRKNSIPLEIKPMPEVERGQEVIIEVGPKETTDGPVCGPEMITLEQLKISLENLKQPGGAREALEAEIKKHKAAVAAAAAAQHSQSASVQHSSSSSVAQTPQNQVASISLSMAPPPNLSQQQQGSGLSQQPSTHMYQQQTSAQNIAYNQLPVGVPNQNQNQNVQSAQLAQNLSAMPQPSLPQVLAQTQVPVNMPQQHIQLNAGIVQSQLPLNVPQQVSSNMTQPQIMTVPQQQAPSVPQPQIPSMSQPQSQMQPVASVPQAQLAPVQPVSFPQANSQQPLPSMPQSLPGVTQNQVQPQPQMQPVTGLQQLQPAMSGVPLQMMHQPQQPGVQQQVQTMASLPQAQQMMSQIDGSIAGQGIQQQSVEIMKVCVCFFVFERVTDVFILFMPVCICKCTISRYFCNWGCFVVNIIITRALWV